MSNGTIELGHLVVGSLYDRRSIAELGRVRQPVSRDPLWHSGIVRFENAVLLFVTLEKTEYNYQDNFDGRMFWWQSQTKQTQASPVIREIIDGKAVLLFARVTAKTKGKASPFVYCGQLTSPVAQGERPVTALFDNPDYIPDAIGPIAEVYRWQPNPAPNDNEPRRSELIHRSNGQGRQLDPVKRRLLEDFAMAHAIGHYSSIGYVVRDTSKGMPYDLECRRKDEVRRVEVKGSTMGGHHVLVTVGEVRAARNGGVITDLYIVHGVGWSIDGGGVLRPIGGAARLIDNWQPADHDLFPTTFEYHVPSA